MDQIHVDKMKYPPLLTYDMEVLNIVGYDFQCTPKGGFFSESAIRFSNLQNKIFQKTILSLKFEFVVYSFWQEI